MINKQNVAIRTQDVRRELKKCDNTDKSRNVGSYDYVCTSAASTYALHQMLLVFSQTDEYIANRYYVNRYYVCITSKASSVLRDRRIHTVANRYYVNRYYVCIISDASSALTDRRVHS